MTGEHDEGFTLIEAVISLLVMSIAVVALVTALATMIQLTQEHRGHAVSETAARSFGQAVQALAESSAALATSAGASGSLNVTDASTLPPPGSNTYLLLDREVVQLSGLNRASGLLTVVRGEGGSTATTHPAGTSVVPMLRCPQAADLTPYAGAYQSTSGVTAVVSAVDYWQPSTSSFVPRNQCLLDFEALCPASTLLPECTSGLFRASLTISTSGDARLKGIGATTTVLVRSGSPDGQP